MRGILPWRANVRGVETHTERGRYEGELFHVAAADGTRLAWFAHSGGTAGSSDASGSIAARAFTNHSGAPELI